MTAKAQLITLIQSLPEDATFQQIAHEVALVAGIREAQEQITRGEGFSVEEILKDIPTWITKS